MYSTVARIVKELSPSFPDRYLSLSFNISESLYNIHDFISLDGHLLIHCFSMKYNQIQSKDIRWFYGHKCIVDKPNLCLLFVFWILQKHGETEDVDELMIMELYQDQTKDHFQMVLHFWIKFTSCDLFRKSFAVSRQVICQIWVSINSLL